MCLVFHKDVFFDTKVYHYSKIVITSFYTVTYSQGNKLVFFFLWIFHTNEWHNCFFKLGSHFTNFVVNGWTMTILRDLLVGIVA